jgi:hypothetical protein
MMQDAAGLCITVLSLLAMVVYYFEPKKNLTTHKTL